MIHERLRKARLLSGMSQNDVVCALKKSGVQLTKAALSKYERGKSSPKATLLQSFAKVLNVPPEYFLREPETNIKWLGFQKHTGLGRRAVEKIHARVSEEVEMTLRLRDIFNPFPPKAFSIRRSVHTLEEAEKTAHTIRNEWNLGSTTVKSMCEVIEDHEGIVIELSDAPDDFHGLSGIANDAHPIIIVKKDLESSRDDRTRFTIAHELGHLVMDTSSVDKRQEKERLAHRFAAAFFVPRECALKELGQHRRRISLQELQLLKQRYGFSMQAWVVRARDLEIITESVFAGLIRQVRRRKESIGFDGNEKPQRFRILLLRALAEGFVSRDDVQRWYPDITAQEITFEEKQMKPRELLTLPFETRNKILADCAKDMQYEYEQIATSDELVDDWQDIYTIGNNE
jgi:Zn-dependent peptidase ImmA (M78 family)/DNA-binding XRE family transcriptional regulator